MEESLREAPATDAWREALAQTIDEQRRRVGERIAGQRDRLRELEARIAGQLDDVTQELSRQQEQTRHATIQTEAQSTALLARQARLDERQHQLDRRQSELDQLRADLAGQAAAEEQRQADFQRRQAELNETQAALAAERAKLREELDAVERRTSELELKQQSLAARERHTQQQRRHLADQFRARKKELTAEIELHRAEAAATGAGQDMQLQLKMSELQGKYEHLREEFEAREAQRDEATQRLAELKTQLETRQYELRHQQAALDQAERKYSELEGERARVQNELQRHLEESRRQAEIVHADLARRTSEGQSQTAEIARLAAELERVRRDAHEQIERSRADQGKSHDAQLESLQMQLDESRRQLASEQTAWERARHQLEQQLAAVRQAGDGKASAASAATAAELARLQEENKQLEAWLAEAEEKAKQAGGGGGQDMDDLRRRFEMAVQDVRELKTKNTELTEQLAKARQSAGVPSAGGGGAAGDWESLKQKLLAELETDFDENDGGQKADKLTVEGAIKITDQVVADKEREIEELRRLLESQSQQVGEVAVGAAVVAQMLDSDALIQQERETLKELQESLRGQLRQAEIDISLERAKLARERSELDEKLRGLEAEKASLPASGGEGTDKGKKPGGRKWLARLGLGEGDGKEAT